MGLNVSRKLIVLILLPLLWACETVPREPAIDASAYLFDVDVQVGPKVAELEPDVSKGSGSGLIRGAGMGFGGCILGGASIDASSGGSSFLLGTALGILVSPACALVGGIAGSGMAESEEEVLARIEKLHQMNDELNYPDALADGLETRIGENPTYAIAGYDTAHISETKATVMSKLPVATEEGPSPEKVQMLLAAVVANQSDTVAMPQAEASAQEEGAVLTLPILRPKTPNGSIKVELTDYRFLGGGVDPKLPLGLSGSLCVTDYETGTALVFTKFAAQSKAMRLEDWAVLSVAEFQVLVERLLDNVANSILKTMGQQVPVGHVVNCQ